MISYRFNGNTHTAVSYQHVTLQRLKIDYLPYWLVDQLQFHWISTRWMQLVKSKHLSQLNLSTVQTIIIQNRTSYGMLFKSQNCGGMLEVFICCHHIVVILQQCSGLPWIIGNFKKLAFSKFLLYFLHYPLAHLSLLHLDFTQSCVAWYISLSQTRLQG